jgi:hypothetical protein
MQLGIIIEEEAQLALYTKEEALKYHSAFPQGKCTVIPTSPIFLRRI